MKHGVYVIFSSGCCILLFDETGFDSVVISMSTPCPNFGRCCTVEMLTNLKLLLI